jgi:hypothetical protein
MERKCEVLASVSVAPAAERSSRRDGAGDSGQFALDQFISVGVTEKLSANADRGVFP